MSCSCEWDGDPPEFLDIRSVCARKDHRCHECGAVICRGERYTYVSGKWDGDFDAFKICRACDDLRARCDLACSPYGELADGVYWRLEDNPQDMELLAFQKRQAAALDFVRT